MITPMNIRATSTFVPGQVAAIQEQITVRVVRATTKGTQRVLNTAQELVPVDTGDLQSSGKMSVTIAGQEVIGTVEFDSDHAAFVEYGTGIRGAASPGRGPWTYKPDWPGMPAQPYARPALEQNRVAILGDFRDEGFSV